MGIPIPWWIKNSLGKLDTYIANRYLYQFKGAFEAGVVDIYAKISFGASGAPTLVLPYCKGIASISRSAAGKYDILLQDPYVRTLIMDSMPLAAAAAAAPDARITADSVATAAAPTLSIAFSVGGTDTDPASGEIVLLKISLKNSSVGV